MLVAGLYAVERATLGYGLFNHTELVTRLLLLIVNGLLFLPAAVASKMPSRSWMESAVRLFVLITAGFGCILNPYLTTLNNHTGSGLVRCSRYVQWCRSYDITQFRHCIGQIEYRADENR